MIITNVLDDRAQQIRFQLTFPIFPLTSQSDTIDPKKWRSSSSTPIKRSRQVPLVVLNLEPIFREKLLSHPHSLSLYFLSYISSVSSHCIAYEYFSFSLSSAMSNNLRSPSYSSLTRSYMATTGSEPWSFFLIFVFL